MKLLNLAALAIVLLLLSAVPALAASDVVGGTTVLSGKGIAGGLGMGLTIIGAGIGFGKIGSSALDGMARQPEVAPRIQTAMIIIAAMLEGATLASVVLSYLVGNGATF
jgi:F-type H+-transporting ATPase subunit c